MQKRKQCDDPVTYFTHIPKTGGTSFTVLLDRFFPADQIFTHKVWHKVIDVNGIKEHPYRLFRGHFGGGGAKLLTNQPIQYLTFLRKPELLVYSTYQFAKRREKILNHELVSEQDMNFLQFLQHPDTQALINNRMTRHLSFDFHEDPSTDGVFLSADTINRVQPLIDSDQTAIDDQQRLARAQNFINTSLWFGLLERFDESLQLLCYQMKWPPIGQTQPLNVHKRDKKKAIGEREWALIRKNNTCDFNLYNTSEVLFNQRHQRMINDLEQYRNKPSDNIEKLLDCHYQAHHTAQRSAGCCYRFDQILLGTGWHQREPMHNQEGYFRWTGPDRISTIDFWLQIQNYQLEIHIHNAINTSVLDQLELTINGQPIEGNTAEGQDRIIHAEVPKQLMHSNGLVRLGLAVDAVMMHKQAFASSDERLVGIAVHQINWIPF